MNDSQLKIKFYGFGSERVDLSKIVNANISYQAESKPFRQFNEALNTVIKKDINALDDKINSLINDITKRLAINGTILEVSLTGNVKTINELINKVEELLSNLIIKKENIKVGIFSTNKKQLKDKIKKLENSIDFISKCQKEFIMVKNEYNKIEERNKLVECALLEPDSEDVIAEDPIERTINFYMNKQER